MVEFLTDAGPFPPLGALRGQLFYGTAIPACLWFVVKDKSGRATRGGAKLRDRSGQTLFINAQDLGSLVDRTHREFSDADRDLITRSYHAWRGQPEAGEYQDVPGFCRAVGVDEIRGNDHVLVPGRYVGAALELSVTGAKIDELRARLDDQLAEGEALGRKLQELLRTLRS